MAKHYYTCPIIAAMMAKYHGVRYGIDHYGKIIWDWVDMLNTPRPATSADDILEDWPVNNQPIYYIHPDSMSIFEPREDDVVYAKVATNGGVFVYVQDKEPVVDKIMQRNGLPFVMPESEGE